MTTWILGVIADVKGTWYIFRKLRSLPFGADIHIKPRTSRQVR